MELPNSMQLFIMLILFIMPIIALINIFKNDFKSCNAKVIWAIIIVTMLPIGWIFYFIFGFSQRIKKEDK